MPLASAAAMPPGALPVACPLRPVPFLAHPALPRRDTLRHQLVVAPLS